MNKGLAVNLIAGATASAILVKGLQKRDASSAQAKSEGASGFDEQKSNRPTVVYTYTDEAPMLATYAFLPVYRAYAETCGIDVQLKDISLASRLLSQFPDFLTAEQQEVDALKELGQLVMQPHANVIKLPNISASLPQLQACISELQGVGFKIPDYPEQPSTEEEKQVQKRYKTVLGSAVNPVLREGNSDRRGPAAVKEFARRNPHSMGKWEKTSKTHVASMQGNDFRHTEKSATMAAATVARIEHVGADGKVTVLKDGLKLQDGEILDGSFMSLKALLPFLEQQMQDAKENGVLFSLHMKATMMKVSDPIIFGHAVKVFFKNVFEKHGATLNKLGVNVNNGFGDLLTKIKALPESERAAIEADIEIAYKNRADLAMVDSDKGVTNLHVPSDVIIDASMPAMIRTSGRMWNKQGKAQDTKAVIPDSCYAGIYDAVVEFCKENGAFDVTTMGTSPNVGLMAQKAEEYGSHDKTFMVKANGTMRVVTQEGQTLFQHEVETGDIWRACQTKTAPIADWVKLAVSRARLSNTPAVFWLDETRAHDRELLKQVSVYIKQHDTSGLDIRTMAPAAACKHTCALLKQGKDCISVTGNVLRDYNTDLFPIIEVGTSAKMLSIVPLMNGGGLFETGAGGSAPKHVEQLIQEGHLRWDSLGEYLALAASLEHIGNKYGSKQASMLGKTLDKAATSYLLENKAPSRKVNQIDNRGSHFYVALYWAQALSEVEDASVKATFSKIHQSLASNEKVINEQLIAAQGKPQDIGGYYKPDHAKATAVMRPSKVFNEIIDSISPRTGNARL